MKNKLAEKELQDALALIEKKEQEIKFLLDEKQKQLATNEYLKRKLEEQKKEDGKK